MSPLEKIMKKLFTNIIIFDILFVGQVLTDNIYNKNKLRVSRSLVSVLVFKTSDRHHVRHALMFWL